MYKIKKREQKLLIQMKMREGLTYKEAKENVTKSINGMKEIQTTEAKKRKAIYSKKYRANKKQERFIENLKNY